MIPNMIKRRITIDCILLYVVIQSSKVTVTTMTFITMISKKKLCHVNYSRTGKVTKWSQCPKM